VGDNMYQCDVCFKAGFGRTIKYHAAKYSHTKTIEHERGAVAVAALRANAEADRALQTRIENEWEQAELVPPGRAGEGASARGVPTSFEREAENAAQQLAFRRALESRNVLLSLGDMESEEDEIRRRFMEVVNGSDVLTLAGRMARSLHVSDEDVPSDAVEDDEDENDISETMGRLGMDTQGTSHRF
jgi:hypothetical protein